MRSRRFVLLLLGCAAVQAPASLAAQRPAGPLWDSYERGAEVVRAALAAHGGADVIQKLSAASFRWEGEEFAPVQGRVPAWDTTGNGRPTVQDVRVDYARSRYVFDREYRFPGGYLNAFHIVGDGRGFLIYNPERARGMGGTEYERDTTGTAASRTLAALAATMPALLLRAATSRATTFRHLGETTVNGRREHAVALSNADGEPLTLYFDAETHLLSRSEEMGPGSLGDEVDVRIFSDYRNEAGVAVPHRLEVRWNGLLTGVHRLVRFSTSPALGDSLLRIPDGYTPALGAGAPSMVKVSDGVFQVERLGGGYRMLVVDTDEGVVVFDAPLSPTVSEAAIALIEKTLPGRPIRWVVVSHHHGDHIGGIPAFAARGATILVAPGSESYITRMATVRRTLGQLGVASASVFPDVKPPTIEVVRGRRTIGHGARAVEVIDVSPTSHASSMLVAYVAAEKLLFQGDLLRINPHSGPVVSPEATRDLAQIIRRFGLDVRTIGAVHGLNGTMDDLRAVLRSK